LTTTIVALDDTANILLLNDTSHTKRLECGSNMILII